MMYKITIGDLETGEKIEEQGRSYILDVPNGNMHICGNSTDVGNMFTCIARFCVKMLPSFVLKYAIVAAMEPDHETN